MAEIIEPNMKSELSANRSFLMGLAMIAIVLFHHGWTVIPGVTAFFSRFGLWGVDIFLFLSGFGCVYALQKYSTGKFYRKRVTRLLPTCMLAGMLVFVIDGYFQAERVMAPAIIRVLSLHRWYIQAILICYLLCPLLYLLIKKFKIRGLIMIIVLSLILANFIPYHNVWKITWAFGRLPVFAIGMYVAMFDLKMTRAQYAFSALCLVAAIITRCRGGITILIGRFSLQWRCRLYVSAFPD